MTFFYLRNDEFSFFLLLLSFQSKLKNRQKQLWYRQIWILNGIPSKNWSDGVSWWCMFFHCCEIGTGVWISSVVVLCVFTQKLWIVCVCCVVWCMCVLSYRMSFKSKNNYINSIKSKFSKLIIRKKNMAGHCSNFSIHWINDTFFVNSNHNSSNNAKMDTGVSCRHFDIVLLHNKHSA